MAWEPHAARKTLGWQPPAAARERVDSLMPVYRRFVTETLEPIVKAYYPALLENAGNEYRKMVELSTKMMLVGHACTEIADYPYDERRQRITCLFGCCCFLADSFLDDFGEEATRAYVTRLERLFATGWFEVGNERETLFYIVVSRLFAERDILEPTLRQAILRLFEAQRRDVEMRGLEAEMKALPRARRLARLKRLARDRSGHAIILLAAFLLPNLSLDYIRHIFVAGALIMFIDDHGDCYADRADRRVTYMNALGRPEPALRRIFFSHIEKLMQGLRPAAGRDLLIAFLTRYYVTRLQKHREQRRLRGPAWAVYE